jgi:hypothetical protein
LTTNKNAIVPVPVIFIGKPLSLSDLLKSDGADKVSFFLDQAVAFPAGKQLAEKKGNHIFILRTTGCYHYRLSNPMSYQTYFNRRGNNQIDIELQTGGTHARSHR